MQEGEGICKSPYEEGLYFVRPEQGTTLQDHSTQWQASLEAPAPWHSGLLHQAARSKLAPFPIANTRRCAFTAQVCLSC